VKKIVLLLLSIVLYFGACEAPNSTTNKVNSTKNNTANKADDKNKLLAFIKQHKMNTKSSNSGLYYSIINKGSGATATLNSTVNVSYTMSDLNGNQIWSTTQSNGEETRSLSQFPAGVSEGLQLIQAGGRIQLIVPSSLAYGETGWGEQVAPNTNLYYDIQLNSVQ